MPQSHFCCLLLDLHLKENLVDFEPCWLWLNIQWHRPACPHPELSGCITTLIVEVANFGAAIDTLIDQDGMSPKHNQPPCTETHLSLRVDWQSSRPRPRFAFKPYGQILHTSTDIFTLGSCTLRLLKTGWAVYHLCDSKSTVEIIYFCCRLLVCWDVTIALV